MTKKSWWRDQVKAMSPQERLRIFMDAIADTQSQIRELQTRVAKIKEHPRRVMAMRRNLDRLGYDIDVIMSVFEEMRKQQDSPVEIKPGIESCPMEES